MGLEPALSRCMIRGAMECEPTSAAQRGNVRRARRRWAGACLAVLLGAGTLAMLHTSGKLLRLEWLAQLLWLAPTLAMVERYRAARRDMPGLRPDRPGLSPLLILSAAMALSLFSSHVCHSWFFFLGWAPNSRDPWVLLSSGMTQFALLTALFTPFLLRGIRRPWIWTGLILLAAMIVSAAMLFDVTAGKPLCRDDHPSFLFRLYAFGRTFPGWVNYMPHWNAGVVDSVGVTSGILAPGLLFLPLWRWGAANAVYTPALAVMFILVVPLVAAYSVRIAGGGRAASWAAGVLALGVSRHFFLWMLHYGTIGAVFSSAFILPFSACVFRVIRLGRRELWLGAALVLSACGLLSWPPGVMMAGGVALAALLHVRRWTWRKIGFLAACGAVVVLLFLKSWLVLLFEVGDVFAHVLKKTAAGAGQAVAESPPLTWDRVRLFLTGGWQMLSSHVQEGNTLLIFLGLSGLLVTPFRSIRNWYLPLILALAALAGWGPVYKPNMQLGRMAIPLFFAAVMPASLAIERILRSREPRFAVFRAAVLALLVMSAWTVARLYGNRGHARYTVPSESMEHMVEWIRESVPAGGRLMFCGSMVHAAGGGHVAPLPMLTGREMMACDYYHFPPKFVEYDYPPRQFRATDDKFWAFVELHNVTHLATRLDARKDYLRGMPDRFHEEATFDRITFFSAKRSPDMFLKGRGRVRADFNRIEAEWDDPAGEVVLKYRWDDRLAADPPVRLYPVDAEEGIRFIGIEPGGARKCVIRFRSRL